MVDLADRRLRVPKARWWFVAAAVVLGGALLPLFIAARRNDTWADDVVSRHCLAPPPLPDNRVLGWLVVGLVGVLMVSLIVGLALVLFDRQRWGVKLRAAVLVAVSLLMALWMLLMGFLHAEGPGPPGQGVDGSGLPCPSG